jgi:NADH-quinone oxidoreductase subunit K
MGLNYYLILALLLFSIGVTGVLLRRNAIIVFMCIELMLNSVNLVFVAFSSFLGNITGQMFVFFIMTVAAAEAAIGLAIVIAMFRNKETINLDEINILKW